MGSVMQVLEVKEHVPTVSQFQGLILGCAVGDAVGAMVETRNPEDCAIYIEKVLAPKDFERLVSLTYDDRSPGQYTDDTQLSRLLMEALIHQLETFPEESFDPGEFSQAFCAFVTKREIVGSGKATRNAAMRLLAGAPWQVSGEPPPAASNGSAMRAAPIGAAYFDDWEFLRNASEDQSRVSHASWPCIVGSTTIAMATAMCLTASKRTTTPEDLGWWNWLALHVSRLEGGEALSDPLTTLITFFFKEKRSDQEIRTWVIETLDGGGWDLNHGRWVTGGVSPYVVPSVIAALYALMRSPQDYWQTIQTSISFGGDADTVAAMAGAMSGALNGQEAIPTPLKEWVNDKGNWQAPDLAQLAERLHFLVLNRRSLRTEDTGTK